jgi:hypothetical protein
LERSTAAFPRDTIYRLLITVAGHNRNIGHAAAELSRASNLLRALGSWLTDARSAEEVARALIDFQREISEMLLRLEAVRLDISDYQR